MSQTLDALVVELRADVKGLRTSLSAAAGDVQRFSGKASTSVDSFQASINRARLSVLALGAGWAAFKIGRGIVDAGVQMEAMQNKMQAATGSAAIAADALAYVRAEAERLGLDIRTASDGFAGFSASALRAGLTLQQTKDIFSGVSEAAVSMRLPAEQVALVFKALEQMAGKGTVSMEELRGQLGDALPGAFEIAAKAMGKTTAEFGKMVANGEVMASDFLPKFGAAIKKELGGSVDEAAQGAQAAFNRLGNAFFDLQAKMADAGFLDAITTAVQGLTTALNDPATVDGLKGFATLLGDIVTAATSAAAAVGSFYAKAGQRKEDLSQWAAGSGSGNAVDAMEDGASTRSLRERVLAEFKAKQAELAKSNPATADANGGYTLGTASTGSASDTAAKAQAKAAKAREDAAKQAEQLKTQMQGKVESFSYNRADPEEQAALDVENQQKMLKEALDAKAITEQEYRDLGLQAETDYQDELTDLRQKAADKEVEMRRQAGQLELQMRTNIMNSTMQLLQVFAGKNKAIAIAMLAFDKARAIAQAIMETHVAAAAALKYDPTGAISAHVTTLGYINVGLIAATGIAQLATMGSGGSSGGVGGGSSSSSSVSGSSSDGSTLSGNSGSYQAPKSVYLTLAGDDAALYSKASIRKLINGINDAISDGSQLRISVAA